MRMPFLLSLSIPSEPPQAAIPALRVACISCLTKRDISSDGAQSRFTLNLTTLATSFTTSHLPRRTRLVHRLIGSTSSFGEWVVIGRSGLRFDTKEIRRTGFPLTSPDLGFEGERVYVSWNGATNVSEWSLAYGDGPEDLQSSISFARTGFESNTTYDEEGFYMAVVGLNADGDCLGVSELHYTSNATSSGLSVSCADIEGVQEASAETSGAGEEADEDSDSSSSTPPTIFRTTLSLEVGGALGLALCLL